MEGFYKVLIFKNELYVLIQFIMPNSIVHLNLVEKFLTNHK